jgi:hypothetical protein
MYSNYTISFKLKFSVTYVRVRITSSYILLLEHAARALGYHAQQGDIRLSKHAAGELGYHAQQVNIRLSKHAAGALGNHAQHGDI